MGITAADSVDGNNGTLENGSTWNTGISGSAVCLDGVNDDVKIAGLLGQPQNITISAWANLEIADTSGSEVISLGDHVGIRLDRTVGGARGFYYDGTTWRPTTTGLFYAGTGWHHFVYVMDDTHNIQKVYVDGVEKGSTAHTQSISYAGLGSNTFLGRHGNGGLTNDFKGCIDEVCVYNRALTAQEVLALYDLYKQSSSGLEVTKQKVGKGSSATATELADRNNGINRESASSDEDALGSDGTNDETNHEVSISAALQAHYAFDEETETIAHDSSGNDNNGTIEGAIPIKGKIDGALTFDGFDDYVSAPQMNLDEISIAAWFYKNEADTTRADALFGAWRRSLRRQLQEGFELRFQQNTPDRLDFILVSKKGNGIRTKRAATYTFGDSIGKWHHVAGTYNKTTGEQRLYVDGLLVDTKRHPAGNSLVPLTYYPDIRIGHSRVDSGYFNGTLDDVRLYNRDLREEEVQELYNQ